ncbi:MAG: hypothetical protein QNJ57_04515 [Flavobacteriaceae bacterium]|nr:hypothetical protein [Flavobacteriaceae bacterium]
MTRRFVYLISSFLLVLPLLGVSQNCNQVNSWVAKAEGYAAGIDTRVLNAYMVMKLTSPAFHDEHFKPVFGKIYSELNEHDKEEIRSKLLSCASDKALVKKGLITAFETDNMTANWNRQVAAINNSSAEENERIHNYESRIRARNRAQHQRTQQQTEAYNRQRRAARGRNSRGALPPRSPHAYNASPKVRKNTPADYQKEAVEMRTVLTYIKGNAAPAHRFTGYANAGLMQKVYDGDFEGFPLGLDDMREKNLMGGLSKINEIKKYERYLTIYLENFSASCAMKAKANYKEVKIQYEVIETQHNVSSSKGYTKPEIYYMKPHFEKDFRRIHKVLSNAAPMDAIWMLASPGETGLNFGPDAKQLFKKNQCESPVLRQLETNLYLASKGKSSLQKLLPYLGK